ncbi:MAG TPA: NUDIX hydrolase [Azospirillaceae bacterium]|nr:NUDIX hydrolase [Azospirillaceae bacterium]
MNNKKKSGAQYAALPVRERDGRRQVMLITSRETKRWIIPKGWPEKNLEPHEVAAREAYEEAGLVGRVETRPLGSFVYEKRLRDGSATPCQVDIFLLEVERELDDWPEKGQRERRWMSPSEAALLVGEAGLVTVLLRLAAPAD